MSRPFSNAQWSPIASEPLPDQKPFYECLGTQNIPNSKKQGGLTKKQLRQLNHHSSQPGLEASMQSPRCSAPLDLLLR